MVATAPLGALMLERLPGLSEQKSVPPPRVVKEDLVVVDGDLSDYPTEHILDIGW